MHNIYFGIVIQVHNNIYVPVYYFPFLYNRVYSVTFLIGSTYAHIGVQKYSL